MCDYSLHNVASRPAKVGDKLITTSFWNSLTRGFAAVEQLNIAVCLLPGTELVFYNKVEYERVFKLFGRARLNQRVARFRQVDKDNPHTHHDALEFPDGRIVLLNRLAEGLTATVLQLPAATQSQSRTTRSPEWLAEPNAA